MHKFFGILFVMIAAMACSGAKVKINTTPAGADVTLNNVVTGAKKTLGQTPLEIDTQKYQEIVQNSKTPNVLQIKKPGFHDESVIVSNFGEADVNYNFELVENSQSDMTKKIDATSTDLFEAQRLLRTGRHDDAVGILQDLIKKYKTSSFIHELMASAHYLKGDFRTALDHYQLSYKYNPNNVDSQKMVQYLESKLGVEKPLAQGI